METTTTPQIRTSRESIGWTQVDLAGALGISQAALSRWESGAVSPRIADVERIARALGGDVSELWPATSTRRRRKK